MNREKLDLLVEWYESLREEEIQRLSINRKIPGLIEYKMSVGFFKKMKIDEQRLVDEVCALGGYDQTWLLKLVRAIRTRYSDLIFHTFGPYLVITKGIINCALLAWNKNYKHHFCWVGRGLQKVVIAIMERDLSQNDSIRKLNKNEVNVLGDD
ncbi:MAG: hypothetical protein QF475_00450 [Candidatus Undinarchaeales archaeon]|jgi:hypothetical protein|nr:hypothetical protein [Candidatus Undinarchaeales archaeon]